MAKKYLDEVNPELAEDWSDQNEPLTLGDVTYGSNKKVWWKGKCGHEWMVAIKNRVNGSECPYCNSIQVLKGYNDLENMQTELAKDWSDKNLPLRPDQVEQYANKRVWW